MDLYIQNSHFIFTKEAREKSKEFKVLPNDVIINTPIKCGTSWIEMICHSLRSHGDMTFDDIDEIVPFVISAYDIGVDPNKDQKWKPRLFKYHNVFEKLPKADNVKYILCIRNPEDVAISHCQFTKNWVMPDEITVSEFANRIYLEDEDPDIAGVLMIWQGILNFYPRRHDPNVLYLHYEDLKDNLREGVKLIADFLEIDADKKLIDLATKQADIKFMKKHQDKFLLKRLKTAVNKNAGLPLNAGLDGKNKGLVREGKSGQKISEEIDRKFQKKWKKRIEKELGFKSYNELRKTTNKELNRPF